jgi:ribosomal protein S6--L-glutamate ligase
MKVAILTNRNESYSNRRLLEELKAKSISVDLVNPLKIELLMGSTKHYDAILNRMTKVSMDPISDQVLNFFGEIIQINNYKSWSLMQDKFLQQRYLSTLKIDLLPSLTYRGELTDSVFKILKNWQKEFGDEYIIKNIFGNQGKGVNLVRGLDSLQSWLETFYLKKDQMILIQPFMKSDLEIRTFSLKNEQSIYLTRKNHQTFKANFHQEGEAIQANPIKEIETILGRITHELELEYFAIDWLMKNNKYYPLDINLVPGFEQLESITKINIAQKIIERIG